jgi:very-short-patch-repair endonuclease
VKTRYTEGDGTIERARTLRRESTPAEDKLWSVLRGRGLERAKFRRQQRFGKFVADFVCLASRLIVEVDGDTHVGETAMSYDARRTAFLEQEGYRVVRFTNADVMGNLEGVADAIRTALRPSPSHPASPGGPLPLPQGERKL